MKNRILGVMILIVVMAMPALAACDLYLQMDGVVGTTNDNAHKDWVSATEIVDNTIKTAGTVGLVINRLTDSTSGLFYRECLSGKPENRAELDINKDGVLWCRIMMSNVSIAQVKPKLAKGDAAPQEEITFSFRQINWDFYGADGKVINHTGWDNELKRAM